MRRITDVQLQQWQPGPPVARDPGLLALAGAVLLLCAPVLPGLSRLVVLPALLLAPGYALLRLLGQAAGWRSVSVAVPASLVLAICSSLVLDLSGVRLSTLSLGSLLGAVTALFLACAYGRHLAATRRHRAEQDGLAAGSPPPGDSARAEFQPTPEFVRPGHPAILEAAPVPLIRFAAEQPNECWQSDFTDYSLADGASAEILTWLDGYSRMALSVTAHQAVTGPDVADSFRDAVAAYGPPASTLTGNGAAYTARFADGRGDHDGFEHELSGLGICQKVGKPDHPLAERSVQQFQQALDEWLRAQRVQPETVADLQALLDTFAAHHNQQQLGGESPATAYASLPKARPGARVGDTHERVLADHVGETGIVTMRHDGRLHHIDIGRLHAGAPILLLVQGSQIRIIDARTGDLLRDLILDPQGQHQGIPPGDQDLGQPGATSA